MPNLLPLLRPELAVCLKVGRLHRSVTECALAQDDVPLLHRLLHLNFMTYLPDDLHVKMDHMSMANALETRSPMLDAVLIAIVAALPPHLKIRGGRAQYVLKLALRDMSPPPLLSRKKHSFAVPLGQKRRDQLRPCVEAILLTPQARCRHYFQPEAVDTRFQEHCAGVKADEQRLWMLLNFELWLRMLDEGTL